MESSIGCFLFLKKYNENNIVQYSVSIVVQQYSNIVVQYSISNYKQYFFSLYLYLFLFSFFSLLFSSFNFCSLISRSATLNYIFSSFQQKNIFFCYLFYLSRRNSKKKFILMPTGCKEQLCYVFEQFCGRILVQDGSREM